MKRVLTVLMLFVCLFPASTGYAQTKKVKILHIMSYHPPWPWPDSQFEGFKAALAESLPDISIEHKVFQMDTKRNTSQEWFESVSKEAVKIIEEYKPDLVYTSDDNAQKYVATQYIGSTIPFVFSGVNADAEAYGYPAVNITGVFERVHLYPLMKLMKSIIPSIKSVAIISDDGITFRNVMSRIKGQIDTAPLEVKHFDLVSTFVEWKEKIKQYQTQVDAIIICGYHTLKGEGKNALSEDVMEWTVQNSRLPEGGYV